MIFQKRYIKRPAHSCFFIINIEHLQAGIAIPRLAAISKQNKPAVDQCIISSAILLLQCIKNNIKVNDFKHSLSVNFKIHIPTVIDQELQCVCRCIIRFQEVQFIHYIITV